MGGDATPPTHVRLGSLLLPLEGPPEWTVGGEELKAALQALANAGGEGGEGRTALALLWLLGDKDIKLHAEWRAEPEPSLADSSSFADSTPKARVRTALQPADYGWRGSKKRAAQLRLVFQRLDRGWDAPAGPLLEVPTSDITTMQALYSLIESPPEPNFGPGEFVGDEEAFNALKEYEMPAGVKTQMYKYQIRSVCRMLQMETTPGTMVNPKYTRFTDAGPDGEEYFVDLASMVVRRSPPRFALSRGGILCEQMGVGKTLMCLALVIASRHQHTRPPTGFDVSGITSEVALNTWPTRSEANLRDTLGIRGSVGGTPSLASLCAEVVAREYPHAHRFFPQLPPSCKALLDRTCVYYRFPPPVRLPRGAKRVPFVPAERFVLAPTTLVVVPNILTVQWQQQIEEHIEPGALTCLTVQDGKDPLPPVEVMAKYDMVLMSLDRFRREGRVNPADMSLDTELLRARWKRIILDEGNIANNMKSDAMILAEALSIERRWIVSGTPTTNLKQGTETATKTLASSEGMLRVHSAAESRAGSQTRDSPMPAQVPSRWSKADLDDVARLGNMLKGFLAAEVFQADDFRRLVTKPLRAAEGPAFGAVERIRYIMSSVMVKHRPGVIDEEVALPPSRLEAEMVYFTDWQRKTYNAVTALIASNVYTSAGEDIDYFLHPRNVEAFNQVVANLHLACTWFSAPDMGIQAALDRTQKYLDGDKLRPEQRVGCEQAVQHMREALADEGWVHWMASGEASLPYDADMLPAALRAAWGHTGVPVLDARALIQIRAANRRAASLESVEKEGHDDRARRIKAEQKAEAKPAKNPASPVKASKGKAAAEKPKAPRIRRHSAAPAPAAHPVGQPEGELDAALDVAAANAAANAAAPAPEVSDAPRPLPSVVRTQSRSAKINYAVRAVLASAAADRFVIFGAWEELAHLTEALELVRVSSVYAGARVAALQRKRALSDFKGGEVKVVILELKFAARGLNLTNANRMIFLSPVWSLDVQAQAIKRIHRIGQTRPTRIDILVTEGTFEEDIVRREKAQRSNEDEKRYSRALIETPRFVEASTERGEEFPVPLANGQMDAEEERAYAAALAEVTAPSRRGTPPVAEPEVGASEVKMEVELFAETAPAPVPEAKQARFASPGPSERRTRFAPPEDSPAPKRARFASPPPPRKQDPDSAEEAVKHEVEAPRKKARFAR